MKAPRGTEDLFGEDALVWKTMQDVAFDLFSKYGYEPIYTPIFELQDVFVRGIGSSTDVVSKEMFHVLSNNAFDKLSLGEELKEAQKLSLRPENTAGIVRCVNEHNLVPAGGPVAKFMYAGSMFRCERPQKGRLRQFNQIGAECLGADEPSADSEMIIMLLKFFEAVGVPSSSMRLLINSMGDDSCRPAYRETIKSYILDHSDELCEDCNRRAQTNPLRAFDCKNPACTSVMNKAPKISDSLCDDCLDHYSKVKTYLDLAGIEYTEDPRLVRGLDYYTRTVFEVQVINGLGSQNAIGGGGRYDKLMETMGGKPTPGIGFALGFERTYLAIKAAGTQTPPLNSSVVYIATVDSSCDEQAFLLVCGLRDLGISAEMDHQGRSLKSQFKQADRMNSRLVVVLGPDEIASGHATVRFMDTHEEKDLPLDGLVDQIASIVG